VQARLGALVERTPRPRYPARWELLELIQQEDVKVLMVLTSEVWEGYEDVLLGRRYQNFASTEGVKRLPLPGLSTVLVLDLARRTGLPLPEDPAQLEALIDGL
jgi:hypothetical protein